MPQTTTTLATSGMHCSSCAMLVDMTLGDIEGVVESKTDHATGQSVVTYDDGVVTLDQIIDAIRSVGYEAEVAG
ncbi:MAG TPA: heavy-metal-associated domain-containing protein [Coriobacteriia bacterium]|nr:heavy-metal-associated domain-containing protein [Coriobacteriia bacterium]